MATRRYLCMATYIIVAALGVSSETAHDLKDGLQSWSHMRQEAGYYTKSGVYRGGLWRIASNRESEVYHCLKDASSRCTIWNTHEKNQVEEERGKCSCAATELSYCEQWTCTTKRVSLRHYTRFKDTLECGCVSPSPNERYCSEWACTERSSSGHSEQEDYQCVEEDVTGEYCYRWNGNISSSLEIESSLCECFERGKHFCKHWECRERSMIRCAAHWGGWCSIEIAVFVGGIFGLYYLMQIWCILRKEPWRELNRLVLSKSHVVGLLLFCLMIPSELLYRFCCLSYLLGQNERTNLKSTCLLLKWSLLLCLPWLIGVVIWGGLLACAIVIPVWIVVFLIIAFSLYFERIPHDRRVHPSSQV